ncbi:hypothetical protein L3X38_025162 [Prunus dulcis]|uniref:Reverse transcriptase domain-containing protein n=1 Tax=Prunus dulcis TaxID=3755 RepID=A0AAD4W2S0_PRUDU|nr:hypothetical protein L3X38_025162 [Prunus dulcis]
MIAWSPSDMPVIYPNIICHRLHVNHISKTLVQKRHYFAPKQVAIIEAEWLANVALVAKQEKGKWRVCIDYTDLNKACPKDNFPLPRIDQLMDSTSGNRLLSFREACSSYNQIKMYDDDMAKTSFIIERETYCCKGMPFGLTNAGAIYQRFVNKIFKEQIGRTMEVYINDMLIKAPTHADHLKNLAKAFSLLRQYGMRLNPKQRPSTDSSQNLPTSADHSSNFEEWTKRQVDEECEVAFQNLKTYLTSHPLLSKPVTGKDLFVYLAVSNSAVSSALIQEGLGAQHPIFYTSKALLDAKTRYPKVEKLILALVVSVRKLQPYYQAHRVIVMTDFPFRTILHSPDASQRLVKWAIKLSQYDLLNRPKTALKAQALADFVAEFTPSVEEEKLVNKKKERSRADRTSTEPDQPRDIWQLRIDGASN